MTHYITAISWILLIGIPCYALFRGSSVALTLSACLVCFTLLAFALAPAFAAVLPSVAHPASAAQGWWTLALLLPLCIAAFPVGARLNRFFMWNIDPFEGFIGLLLGIGGALFTVHAILSATLLLARDQPDYPAFTKTLLVRQLVHEEALTQLRLRQVHLEDTAPDE